jgi:hypothetical protein
MSVIDINERWMGRIGERMSNSSTYERVLIVRTDTVNDGPEEVIGMVETAGYTVGSTYPSNSGAYLSSIRPNPLGRQVWEVTLSYETATGNPPTTDPVDADPVIRWSFAQYNKVTEGAYDRRYPGGAWDGGPYVKTQKSYEILNSVGRKFTPEPTQQVSHLLCDITLWRNTFNPEDARYYINTINDDTIIIGGLGVGEWEGYMRNFGAAKKFKANGDAYYEYNWQIEIHEDTWVKQFLDQGFYKWDDNGDPVLILDVKKQKLKKPALLNGWGVPLPASADPVWIEYLTYFPSDWSTLNLPTSA